MLRKIFLIIKKILTEMNDAAGIAPCFKNAHLGWPNSQAEVARYYLEKQKDYVEAYAWADAAYFNGSTVAAVIKAEAEKLLKPEEIKLAWDTARAYKKFSMSK